MKRLRILTMALVCGTAAWAPSAMAQAGSCPTLQWTTLGTAGGPVPTPTRSEPANLLTIGNRMILVDAGDGTVDQLARINLDLRPVHDVFISHAHLDHTGGLAAVIGLRWMNQFPGQLTVYGPPGTKQLVAGIVASMQPAAQIGFGLGSLPDDPAKSVRAVELDDAAQLDLGDGLTLRAAANSHFNHDGAPSPGNVSLSYRFAVGARSITYTGDTGPSDAVTRLADHTSMLVSEVALPQQLTDSIRHARKDAPEAMFAAMALHLATHHLPPELVGQMAAQAGAGQVVLTHFAIPGPLDAWQSVLLESVSKAYHGHVSLARDLNTFTLDCAPERTSR